MSLEAQPGYEYEAWDEGEGKGGERGREYKKRETIYTYNRERKKKNIFI